jgi:hypothetical protein
MGNIVDENRPRSHAMPATTGNRAYLIRVTRHPLDPHTRERMRHAGNLPDDYRSRSVEETDFVRVTASDDLAAIYLAANRTKLVFKGERAVYDEVLPDGGGYRELVDAPAVPSPTEGWFRPPTCAHGIYWTDPCAVCRIIEAS